jgi:hypothetical protein
MSQIETSNEKVIANRQLKLARNISSFLVVLFYGFFEFFQEYEVMSLAIVFFYFSMLFGIIFVMLLLILWWRSD